MSYTQNDETREQLDPSTVTLNKLLAENSNLIQTINEFQRKGRIHEAMKYQELLHKNLMYLSKEMEPSLVAELEENPPPMTQGPPQNSQQPISVGPSSVPPPSSSSGGTSIASPSRQPHSISSSQQNGHLSPYSSGHGGPSPHNMRNGHQMQQQQQQQSNLPPQEQPLPPQMPPPGVYGMPNGYPYQMPPHQGPYMNGLPPGHLPPR